MSRTIERTCAHCGNEFQAEVKAVNRGGGVVCSRQCGRLRALEAKKRKPVRGPRDSKAAETWNVELANRALTARRMGEG